jgi:hypothetical protein
MTKSRETGWGGNREGAGRKPVAGVTMVRKTVRLTPEVIEQLQKLGGGNLSAGIREAARLALSGQNKVPVDTPSDTL